MTHVAAEAGVSRQCLSKWVNCYRTSGEAGLLDRDSIPARRPTAINPNLVAQIEDLRRTRKWSARLTAIDLTRAGTQESASTVAR